MGGRRGKIKVCKELFEKVVINVSISQNKFRLSSSLHGVAWYTRIAHGLSKTSVFVLIMIITFGMPFAMAKFFFTWLVLQ